ncbi:hypothetical protein ACRAWF_44715 [Streptomyces sp. L7]
MAAEERSTPPRSPCVDRRRENGDNNGEYWTVTTGDGTRYVFGLNKPAGAGTERTNSVWTTPVFGDDSGEPGYDQGSPSRAAPSPRPRRWNPRLRRGHPRQRHVVLVHSRSPTTTARTARAPQPPPTTAAATSPRSSTDSGPTPCSPGSPPAKVEVHVSGALHGGGLLGTEGLPPSDNWPDVPFDTICASGADCHATGPAFSTRKRLTGINTFVWSAETSTAHAPCRLWDTDSSSTSTAGTSATPRTRTLTLKSIVRTGKAGTDPRPAPDHLHLPTCGPTGVDARRDRRHPAARPRPSVSAPSLARRARSLDVTFLRPAARAPGPAAATGPPPQRAPPMATSQGPATRAVLAHQRATP